MDPINTEFSSFGFHGTATATTVAHENGTLGLVLVERELGSEGSLQTTSPASPGGHRPDCRAAERSAGLRGIRQPARPIDAELSAAEAIYDVEIVNESFGADSREALEMLQQQYCPLPVSLAAYFALSTR